jgi:hypothetical protein
MRYINQRHIPGFFREFYEDLSEISFIIKREVTLMTQMSYVVDYANSGLKYINEKLKTVGQDNQYLGKTPEKPDCFLDGERFFQAGLYGCAIVCRLRGQMLIIDPIGEGVYWYADGNLHVNGAKVKKTIQSLDMLTHHSCCNSLLLIFKQLGQVREIQLDPNGKIQNLN